MKKVLEQYAAVVVAVCVALMVTGLFFGAPFGGQESLPDYMGNVMKQSLIPSADKEKLGDAFDRVMNQSKPVFIMQEHRLVLLTSRLLSEILIAKDADGNEVNVIIEDILDENFEATAYIKTGAQNRLHFAKAGIFWLKVSAMDAKGQTECALVRIFVNER